MTLTSSHPTKNASKIAVSCLAGTLIAGAIAIATDAVSVSNAAEADPANMHQEPSAISSVTFDAPVDDVRFDWALVDDGILGPVFVGDYDAYLDFVKADCEAAEAERAEAERIAAEERERAEREAAEAMERAGAANANDSDQANIAATGRYVDLPEVTLPPISDAPNTTTQAPAPDTSKAPSLGTTRDPHLPENYRYLTQADFAGKSLSDKITLMGALARQDMRESGILASITIAQAILESGWMESGLAKYNALFGIKACKLENNWRDSPWTGSAKNFETGEEYTPGTITTITAAFRTYPNVWDSIKDHSSYLINSKKGSSARYPGIVGMRDPRATIQLIKDGGYATSSGYVDYIMRIVDQYDLTRFDN